MLQDRHTSLQPSAAVEPLPRVFLLLQGPHGPFFDRLGRLLRAAGAQVWRCAFNAGDEFFWSDPAHLLRHTGSGADWPAHLDRIIAEKGVTDIVLYGDVRPIHAAARMAAQLRTGPRPCARWTAEEHVLPLDRAAPRSRRHSLGDRLPAAGPEA